MTQLIHLKKTQKAIIVLSIIWLIISIALSCVFADTDGYFKISNFFVTLIVLTFPCGLYWAGVWIWGFGYLVKIFLYTLKSLQHLLKIVLCILAPVLLSCSFAYFMSDITLLLGIEIPSYVFAMLVAGLSKIIFDKLKTQKNDTTKLIIVNLLICVVSLFLYYTAESINKINMPKFVLRNIEKQYPIFTTLKQHEPDTYEKIRKKILSSDLSKNNIDEAAINEIQQIISSYTKQKLPYISDALSVRLAKSDLELAKNLSLGTPEKCTKLLLGQSIGYFDTSIAKDTLQQRFNILNDVVAAPKQPAAGKITQQEWNNMFLPIIKKHMENMQIRNEDILSYVNGTVEPKKACTFWINVVEDVLAMPEKTAVLFMRGL